MTEQEIIAKLNGADVFLRDRADCIPAPLNEYDVLILKDIANTCDEAVTLIERLQSKIARLKKYDEERDIKLHYRLTENAKHEAYKEFAERLCDGKVSNDKTVIEIKVLLKEMVGDNDGNNKHIVVKR